MQTAPVTCILATIWLLSSSPLAAVIKPKPLAAAAGEVITWIEANDPSTQTQKDAWAKVRKAIETAGQEAQSEAGLKLSLSYILEHWNGKAFRVLDASDAQQWALLKSGDTFPDSGAWYQSRGQKWTVQYVSSHGKRLFKRGDEVKTSGFHPILSTEKKQQLELEVQSSPMSAARQIKAPIRPRVFADYVLAETQAAGTLLTQNNQKICLQKAWFWMNDAVNAHLLSKISFQTENCAAQLIDLRDGFGLEAKGALKISKKIPTVVLVNSQTREGAARLAQRLKTELNARVIGETTGLSSLPEQQYSLKALPWSLIAYAGYGKPVEPDEAVKDSLVYAEGIDQVQEQGLKWLGDHIKK